MIALKVVKDSVTDNALSGNTSLGLSLPFLFFFALEDVLTTFI